MDKLSYAIGMNMASNLMQSGLKNIDVQSFTKAFTDTFADKPEMPPQEASRLIQEYFGKVQELMLEKNLNEGREFLEKNSKKAGITSLPSGLQYEVIKEGTGVKPKATDKVKVHYHGTLLNGTVFDSSVERGQPASFGVNQVIRGWVEALQLMPVGSKWKLYIPSDLAYGQQGAGSSIEPNSTLIFEVELLDIL